MRDDRNEQALHQRRIDAEAKLARRTPVKAALVLPVVELLHELQVYKIELEVQNEKLRQSQIELEKSRDRYVDFYDFAPVGYLSLSNEGMIDEINLTGAALLGVERNKLPHRSFATFVATEDRDRWYRHFLNVLTRDDTLTCELVLQRGDGSRLYVRLDCMRLSKAGKTAEVRTVLTDITESKKTERILRQHKRIIDTAMDGFWMADEMGNLQEANEAYAKMSGYSIDELVNMHISQLEAKEKSREEVEAHMAEIIAQGSDRFETCHCRKDGQEIEVEVSATFMAESRQFFVFCHDITKRKAAEEEIRNLAFYDTLTQLPNRRMLSDRLAQAMASSKRSNRYGALMFIDLDNFKSLNDAHGHNVGDLLLMQVARRITSCVREMDTVARFGGDEFVVMLSELDVDETESIAQSGIVAEKIRTILAEPYVLIIQQDGKAAATVKHHCTSSIGIVLFINNEASQDDIIKWADMAMYQAKDDGRNLIRFFDLKV